MITGANRGGKSTFLRGLGLAQLMMQAGMFVAATAFTANVRDGVFTHYKREEDATMTSGKLVEELERMNGLVELMGPHSLLLSNESFASTNEREASEIARQIVRAMLAKNVKVCYVTHMYDLAHTMNALQPGNALFLRAERQQDGQRTFKLVEGEPLPTSYGQDSYQRIFGTRSGQAGRCLVNVRRLQLDVDKALQRPDLLELAEAIDGVRGVEAVNVTVTDIDLETVGTEVLSKAITSTFRLSSRPSRKLEPRCTALMRLS